MSWRIISASAIGTSHLSSGLACQDSCLALVHNCDTPAPILSIFVADGAGSAIKGGEGAELAVEAATNFISHRVAHSEIGLSDDLAVECILAIREKIFAAADQAELKARDFACTILGVLASPTELLVMQIGDGAIVLEEAGQLIVPIVPMTGEYANMTHFVTDEDAVTILATKHFPSSSEKIAVFTDGIQRLALNMSTNTAFEPFFSPLFGSLLTTREDQEDQLQSNLVNFLNSAPVNERTDDDKTLVLAALIK